MLLTAVLTAVSVRCWAEDPIRATSSSSRPILRVGETAEVVVSVQVDPGWHINSNEPGLDFLIPTKLDFELPALGSHPFVLDGGGGLNSLSIDDASRGAAQYQFGESRLYEVESADFFAFGRDFAYDNMSAIGLTCSNSDNVVSVLGVSTDIDIGNQVTILMSGGGERS